MEGNSHMNTNGEEQEVKKKKKIIAVYNTHNSKTGIKDPRAEKKQQAASDDSERSRKGGKTGCNARKACGSTDTGSEDRGSKACGSTGSETDRRDREARGSAPEPSGSIRERKQTGRPGKTDTES